MDNQWFPETLAGFWPDSWCGRPFLMANWDIEIGLDGH
jgi:hypothetical protein